MAAGKRTNAWRVLAVALLALLVLVVVLQNMQSVEAKVLLLSVRMPRAALLFGTLLAGFLLGRLTAWRPGDQNR